MLTSEKSALSAYQQNLLRANAPVTVVLAGRPQSLASLLALVPGSILSFETRFDEPWCLTIGDQGIGLVDAIKVGNKFGVQVREMGAAKTD